MARPTKPKGERVWVAVAERPLPRSTSYTKQETVEWVREAFPSSRGLWSAFSYQRATLTIDETASQKKKGKR